MERRWQRLPFISSVFVAVIVGIIVGAGLFQLASKGAFPFKSKNSSSSNTFNQSTQRVVNEENAVIDVVDKVSDSVVAISTTRKVFNPFDPFSVPRSQSSTIGTGFVVSDKGIIVTNKHVVSDTGQKYTVITKDDKKIEIQKIFKDPVLDLAVVQVDNLDGLKPLELGDSSKLKVGQNVVAIGNALGRFTNTVTTGIVSGLGRRVVAGDPYSGDSESLEDLIQTDAAINPGNSGGPLLNVSGQVVGVNVATTEGAQNIGFAVPINSVKKIIDDYQTHGTISRAYLGVRYQFLDRNRAIRSDVPQGAYIEYVVPGSAAEKVGVQEGDIIVKIDGQPIDSEKRISEMIAAKKIGDNVSLKVWRDGKEIDLTANLQDLPNQQ